MLLRFFGGRGGGGAIARYMVDPDRSEREAVPPEVLRGDIERTRELTYSIDRKWEYLSTTWKYLTTVRYADYIAVHTGVSNVRFPRSLHPCA